MIFILVNGRTPCKQCTCALCGERIGASYLREIGTQLCYCDHDCYVGHCNSAVMALTNRTRAAALVGLAPYRSNARSEAEQTAR
jgi:hypothetical protein